jgi:peptide-methionine (R)-S-oxide reductase
MSRFIGWALLGLLASGCQTPEGQASAEVTSRHPVEKSEAEWKKILTPEQFHILREKGTEPAGSSPLNQIHDHAIFVCAACNQTLFSTKQKFDSGTGWPSFWAPIDPKHIETVTDRSFGATRTEVRCSRCGGHLGHVFDDGPKPTGLRYCMNGAAMKTIPAKD